jgi:hypothetical protein
MGDSPIIKKYKVNDCPKIREVISVQDITKLGLNGFVVIQVEAMSEDELSDYVEAFHLMQGDSEYKARMVVIPSCINIWTVVEEAEKELNSQEKPNDEKTIT